MRPAAVPELLRPPVRLRAWRAQDVPVVVAASRDPLIPLITTVPRTPDASAALAYVERQQRRLPDGVGYSFAIADAASDEAVGQIGLWLKDADHGRATIGYWVEAAHRRRGYTTAALDAVTRWARDLDGIHRLELYVEPWNEGSWRAAERCGFEREGLLRSWQVVGDQRRDMYVYGLVPSISSGGGRSEPPEP